MPCPNPLASNLTAAALRAACALSLVACHGPGVHELGVLLETGATVDDRVGQTTTAPEDTTDTATDETDTREDTADTGDTDPSRPGEYALQFDGPLPTRLLVISVDALRRDHVGPQGDQDSLTPFLDGLRAEGVDLAQHQACSSAPYAAMVCALSGRRTHYASYAPDGDAGEAPLLLGDHLRQLGFGTALVTADGGHCAASAPGTSYDQLTCLPDTDAPTALGVAIGATSELAALGDPWFVHLHLTDPRAPYDPPADYLTALDGLPPTPADLSTTDGLRQLPALLPTLDDTAQTELLFELRLRYGGQVAYLNDSLPKVWSSLQGAGLLDETLVLFLGTHGEQLMDHGAVEHGGSLYGEETDVAAFFWAPNLVPRSWTEPTTHADLLPTILEVLGGTTPPGADGAIIGANPAPLTTALLVPSVGSVHQTVTSQGQRLHYVWNESFEYYDLWSDPGETNNLYDSTDPNVTVLWNQLVPGILDAAAALGLEPPSDTP